MNTNLVRTAAVIFAFLASSFSTGASAQSLRCKGDLAQIGNSKGTILQKCGEPVMKDTFCKPTQSTASTTTPIITPATPVTTTGNSSQYHHQRHGQHLPAGGRMDIQPRLRAVHDDAAV
jgi:hypothetical protein